MDLDIIFFWLALMLVGTTFLATGGRGGWAAVTGMILVAAPILLHFAPGPAPWIVFGVTGVFVVLPALLARAVTAFNLRQNHAVAQILGTVVAVLHPLDDWPATVSFFSAMAMLQRGREAAARQRLESLAALPGDVGLLAQSQLARLDGDWRRLADNPPTLPLTATALLMRLRALGETGRTIQMLALLRDNEATLRRGGSTVLRQGLLCIMAFGGRSRGLAAMLAGPFAAMPSEHKRSWWATAQIASGDRAEIAAGNAVLRDLSETADPATRRLAATRLARPLANATTLAGEDLALLDRLEHEVTAAGSAGRPARRRNVVTLALVLANLAVFTAEWVYGSSPDDDAMLYTLGGLFPPAVLEHGEWWRVGAAMFLHAGVIHLAANMLGLLVLGSVVEPMCGRWRTLLLYFGAGFGSMLSIIAANALGWMRPALLVGASGAIMGLIGGLGAAALRQWIVSPSPLARQRAVRVGLALVLQTGIDLTTPRISLAAHISGTVIGFVIGWLMQVRWTGAPAGGFGPPTAAVSRARSTVVYAFVALAVAASLWAAAGR